ncbi:MAG TPA: M28 family peptidase [Myxococcota bacterium]|jgi:hypothetical protein
MGMLALGLAVATLVAAPPAPSAPPDPVDARVAKASRVRDRASAGNVAWDVLSSLTTEVGARPTGSPAMARAKDWALAKLKALGFSNVHAEPFTKKNAWLRGHESLAITAPYAAPLALLGLGNSVPTPAGGVDGDVAVFPSLEALVRAAPSSLTGKIALVNQPMVPTQSGEGYGIAVRARGAGASIAAAHGAVAFLTRSIATGDGRAPHTGAMGYADGIAKIPCAAIGTADADLLARLVGQGATVRLHLELANTVIAEAPAWNVVGEIPGRTKEVVVIGGHLDSWDPAQGANDDGAGVAITVAAARLFSQDKPLRTIRVVLWGSEESGGSGDAYAKAHVDEVPAMALASESDFGAGHVFRVALPKGAAADPAFTGLATVLAPLHTFVSSDPARYGGSDVEDLEGAGVPIIEIDPDGTHYFDIHHSADDTLDKIHRVDLEQGVAVWAALLSFIADSDVNLRAFDKPAPRVR